MLRDHVEEVEKTQFLAHNHHFIIILRLAITMTRVGGICQLIFAAGEMALRGFGYMFGV